MKSVIDIPLFAALDLDQRDSAIGLAKDLRPYVGGFKIGPRLTMKYGDDFVRELAKVGPVLVDNKYYDIPTTMEASVRATFSAGASYATIHAAAGPETLKLLADVEEELNKIRPFQLLVVTVLTSYEQNTLPPNWIDSPIDKQVEMLAQSAMDSGLTGFVCSAHEVQKLREMFPKAFLLTPGIRFMNEGHGDQKRVMSPQQAMKAGSSALVVGRPLYLSDDPIAVAKSYHAAVSSMG
ncbi:MAG: orotidine-5'-phosphate decarboxylase [Bdellovibrionales bacterium]|nr:orotidine-5'-phosphate decarboxylase [Bdellovibrionales bacterium]